MKTETIAKPVNGVDVARLFETIEMIKESPSIATFRFRLHNKWLGGGQNRSTIKNFYGAGEEQDFRKKPFVLDADEPPLLLGKDQAPNPVEYALTALAACVTTSIVYHAAAKGIPIEEIESRVEGDIDLHGFLGMDADVPRGYKEVRMKVKIKADVPPEKLEELVALGPSYSPVYDTFTRAVPVKVMLDR